MLASSFLARDQGKRHGPAMHTDGSREREIWVTPGERGPSHTRELPLLPPRLWASQHLIPLVSVWPECRPASRNSLQDKGHV
jgi:hypothetical protein